MWTLSKSKLIAFRQCPKRLWLEIHKPELRDDSGSEVVFKIGHEVGELAQKLFDTDENGVLIDPKELGWPAAYSRSSELLKSGTVPIFEATMRTKGAMAMADVMLPDRSSDQLEWKMIEVKSSTSVKDYHRDDIAIQMYIALKNGVRLSQAGIAHINGQFVYPGHNDYDGILHIEDITEEAMDRYSEVKTWIKDAQTTAAKRAEPKVEMGSQCTSPYVCGFCAYCSRDAVEPEFSTSILPSVRAKRLEEWRERGIDELRKTPDDELSPIQLRVKTATLNNKIYFDMDGADHALSGHGLPAYFLDFETAQFAIPTWVGTRPYEQIPFQFSLHRIDRNGKLSHAEFLDTSGVDTREPLVQSLIKSCGRRGPIYVYNIAFERRVLATLASRFPGYAEALNAIIARLKDLLPIVRNHYYNPIQRGSWSLKAVLPAICPELNHGDLEEVQHGLAAVEAFKEAIAPKTNNERKEEIRKQLIEYCKLDTLATVKIWEFFRG